MQNNLWCNDTINVIFICLIPDTNTLMTLIRVMPKIFAMGGKIWHGRNTHDIVLIWVMRVQTVKYVYSILGWSTLGVNCLSDSTGFKGD